MPKEKIKFYTQEGANVIKFSAIEITVNVSKLELVVAICAGAIVA